MPAERVSMRRVREILRLSMPAGRATGRSRGIARSTVALTLERLAAAGLAWPLPEALSDRVLEGMLYAGTGARQGLRRKGEPDWTRVHRELRRAGVTLMLLWEEYRAAEPDGYAYSRWCELYRAWEGRLSPTMRQSLRRANACSSTMPARRSRSSTAGAARCARPRCSSRRWARRATPTPRRPGRSR